MAGPPDAGAGDRLAVAAEAGVEYLVRRRMRERNDRGLGSVPLNVLTARSMAALAPGLLGWLVRGRSALGMWILVEVLPNVGMAGLADLATDKIVSSTSS
jgi:hypothetical protein